MALAFSYPMNDDAASTTVVAAVGSNGTLQGGDNTEDKAVAGPGGLYLGGLDLNGSDDRISIDGFTESSTSITFSAWVKSTQTGTSLYLLDFDTVRLIFAFAGTTGGRPGIFSTSWVSFGVDETPDDGAWHLMVFTVDGTTAECFIDDVQSGGSETITVINLLVATATKIGSNNGGTAEFFDGVISGVQFFDTALDSAAVSALFSEGKPQNSVAPVITNNLELGTTIYSSTGTWSDGSVSYQWVRADDDSGTNEADISGETNHYYRTAVADTGKYVRCDVTFTNDIGSTTVTTAYEKYVPTYDELLDESVAYFPLNETGSSTTAYNRSGANGTYTNLTPSSATVAGLAPNSDSAIAFDSASSQYVATSTAPTTAGSISVWFETSSDTKMIVGTQSATRAYLGVNGNKLSAGIGTQSWEIIYGTTVVNDGETHHGVVSWDGTTVTLFVDGIQEYSAAQSGSAVVGTNFNIGAHNNSGATNFLTGTIDEVIVLPRALSWDEVLRLYEDKPRRSLPYDQLKASAIAHFPCNDRTGSTATNLVGTDGTGVNMQFDNPWDVPSRSLQFDGVDGLISGSISDTITYPFTLSARGDIDNDAPYDFNVLLSLDVAATSNQYFSISYYIVDNKFCVTRRNTTPTQLYTANTYSFDTSYHVVAIFHSATSISIYVDGVLDITSSSETSVTLPAFDTAASGCFRVSSPAYFYKGHIKDARIFNDARTAQQIVNLASSSAASTSQLDDANLVAHWPLEESAVGTHYDISGNGYHATASGGVSVDNSADAPYSIVLDNGYTEDGSAIIPEDSSNPGYDVLGSVLSHPTPRVQDGLHPQSGTAFRFDGVDQYLTAGDVYDFETTDAFSISCWVQNGTEPTGSQSLVSKQDAGSPYDGYALLIAGGVAGKPYQAVLTDDAAKQHTVRFPRTSGSDARHVVLTVDGSDTVAGIKCYENAVELSPTVITSTTHTGTMITDAPFNVGARDNAEIFFAGVIDEVMVFETALTATEVGYLYRIPATSSNAMRSHQQLLIPSGN